MSDSASGWRVGLRGPEPNVGPGDKPARLESRALSQPRGEAMKVKTTVKAGGGFLWSG